MNTIIKAKQFTVAKWAGGTATQLFIYPPTADYKTRNFDFRISTAKVDIEKSEFTDLPDVSRKLMVLEGEINIIHKNHHSKKLGKFEGDTFQGDWNTSSVGKCTDFNLMTTGKTQGDLQAITLRKNEVMNYTLNENWNWLFIFSIKGQINIQLGNQSHTLKRGDLFALNKKKIPKLILLAEENSEMALAKLSTNSNT